MCLIHSNSTVRSHCIYNIYRSGSFQPPIFHPNVYKDGRVCLSIIGENWRPNITLRAILVGIQELLDTPNRYSPANSEANQLLVKRPEEYKKRVLQEAQRFAKSLD